MKHLPYGCALWIFLLFQTACHAESVSRDGWSEWSLWDSCSAQCEYGISTRTRQCLRKDASAVQDLRGLQVNHTSCPGPSAQIKVCRLKACPPEQKSPHQTACSQYDSRMFSGKQYVWEPFIHANDACKLSCRAKGVHFYANLPDKADDGIPCKLGMAEAVCVKGVCKRVGCDGIVESGAVKDTCGVCRGEGSSCQTISGIFTSTNLKRGLNYIISIPAGSTNINVTELQASRNLLVLQAETGQSIINENTSSPVSGVFEAAGTSFTYGAKSASSPKETIISPGPTNTSVILKLLMRGSNPSIMYTFSVPKAVSETVIQQIRRHSQPIELPPETSDNRNAQFQLSSNRHSGSASFPKFVAQRTTNSGPETSSAAIPTKELLELSTTKPSIIDGRYPHFSIQDKDDVSNQGSKDKTTASFGQTHWSRSEHVSVAGSLDKGSTSVYWNSGQTTEISATQSTITHEAKPMENIKRDQDLLLETTNAPFSVFNTEEHKDDYKEENASRSINKLTVGPTSNMLHHDNMELNNAVSRDEEQDTSELSAAHSVNSTNEDKQSTNSLTSANIHIINSSHDSMGKIEGELQRKINIPSYPDSITDFPSQRAQESDVNTHYYSNVTNSNVLGKPHHVNYDDSFVKGTTSNPDPSKGRLKYKIPRYSQSFTFVERYQDTYNKNRSSSSPHKSRARQHARHRHNHRESSSQKLSGHRSDVDSSQTAEHRGHGSQSKDNELERNAKRNVNHRHEYGGVDEGQDRKEDAEREHGTSEFGTVSPGNRHSNHVASEIPHGNGDEQVSREMRLRDRDLLIEERRRRMEEQRLRYNERLRDYQEKLRQRQHAIDESRRRNYYNRAASEESGNNNNVHQPEKIPSLSSSSSMSSYGGFGASRHNDISSLADDRAQTSQSRVTASNTDFRSYNAGHNPDDWRQEQVQQRPREHPRPNTSNRRQTALQPNRNTDDVYSNRQLSGGYDNGNQHSREPPRGQAAPASVPVVVQPPRLEHPDQYDVDGARSHGQQNSHRAHSHEARYIPGSRAALQSAENGAETLYGQHGHISSGRQPTEVGQIGVDSQSNQIPVETARNTHSAIYEWRVSGLTECTHSCGGGVQQTVVVCVDTVTQAVVTDDNCRYLTRPDQLAMPCNTRPCSAEWSPGPWSPCSVTCGNGEQTRVVTCQARVSPTLNMTMPSSSCEGQERVPNRQSCAKNPCSSWKVGAWSNCSASCGDGQKSRDVQCVDLDNNVVSADACLELKPDSEERCNLGDCGKGWFFTEWPAECPVDCGTGELTRQVFCADDAGSALPDSRCDINQRPAVSQPCRVSRPCGGLWFTGEWMKCDSKCGSGSRHREVLCIKELPGSVHAVVGEENCEESDKPEVTELCQGPPCTPEWYMTSWSQCSQSCGTGYRSREVKCLDSEQKPQEDCALNTKPKTRDSCNIHSCDDIEDKHSDEDPGCTDKFAQCKVVKRARLCRYDYYKTVCCKSCAAET